MRSLATTRPWYWSESWRIIQPEFINDTTIEEFYSYVVHFFIKYKVIKPVMTLVKQNFHACAKSLRPVYVRVTRHLAQIVALWPMA